MRKKELLEQIKNLSWRIDRMDHAISILNREVNQLKCEHNNISFINGGFFDTRKQCADCGKVLKKYDDELEFKRDQAAYHRRKAAEIES